MHTTIPITSNPISAGPITIGPPITFTLDDPKADALRAQLQKHVAVLKSMGITDLSKLGGMSVTQGSVLLPSASLVSPLAPSNSSKLNTPFSNARQRSAGVASGFASKALSFSGQGTQLASQTLPLNVCYWAADWITLADNTNVILENPNQYLVILTNTLTVGANVTFTYERSPVVVPKTPPKPQKPGTPSVPSGFTNGINGTNGTAGGNGGSGASFPAAPTVEIWVLAMTGSPAVDLRGQDGAEGGTGGDGGDGGDGGKGVDAVRAMIGFKQGNTQGGNGGNGGAAGNGGPGGNGATGGHFSLYAPQIVLNTYSSAGLPIDIAGGAAVAGGIPSVPGSGGSGGAPGAAHGFNPSRNQGSNGSQGAPGKQGQFGLTNGTTGLIQLIAIDLAAFNTAINMPAIFSMSSSHVNEGDTVSITGQGFLATDVVQMVADASGTVVPCATNVVSNTLASFQIPAVWGGSRQFYILQTDRTKTNSDNVYVMPTLNPVGNSTGENAPRMKPGTQVTILGTGFANLDVVQINGLEPAGSQTTFVDSHTLHATIARPTSGVTANPDGEPVSLSVVNPTKLSSNMIQVTLDTYRIFVFGDSIAWGCGLTESEKFYSLVFNQVSAKTAGSIGVYLTVAAHTGAIIGVGSPTTFDPSQVRISGEIPSSYPTILQQVNEYASIPDAKDDVALVLMDGGINDVDLKNVFNWSLCTQPYMVALTQQHCHAGMKVLLSAVASAFPNAKIVVTGYYAILSGQSDSSLGPQFAIAFLAAAGFGTLAVGPFYTQIVARCGAFASAANSSLAQAVSEVNTTLGGTARIFFANPGFTDFNAVFAPWAFAFGMNGLLTPQDAMASTRAAACAKDADGSVQFCDMASLGHPNHGGAQQYASKIFPFL